MEEPEVREAVSAALGKSWEELLRSEGLSMAEMAELWAHLKPSHGAASPAAVCGLRQGRTASGSVCRGGVILMC